MTRHLMYNDVHQSIQNIKCSTIILTCLLIAKILKSCAREWTVTSGRELPQMHLNGGHMQCNATIVIIYRRVM